MAEFSAALTPTEAIDVICALQRRQQSQQDSHKRHKLQARRDLLKDTFDATFIPDPTRAESFEKLFAIEGDLLAIEQDMRACEARGDYGPSFVALSQAYLALLTQRDRIKTDIAALI